MRGALVTTIYRKTLTVSGTVLNSAFSVGEIVNFMSTDTDRIVNSCPSFHALWSIPFQVRILPFSSPETIVQDDLISASGYFILVVQPSGSSVCVRCLLLRAPNSHQ